MLPCLSSPSGVRAVALLYPCSPSAPPPDSTVLDVNIEYSVPLCCHGRCLSGVCGGPDRRCLQGRERRPERAACPGSCGGGGNMDLGRAGLATASAPSAMLTRRNRQSTVPDSIPAPEWARHPGWLHARGCRCGHGVQLTATPKATDNVGKRRCWACPRVLRRNGQPRHGMFLPHTPLYRLLCLLHTPLDQFRDGSFIVMHIVGYIHDEHDK